MRILFTFVGGYGHWEPMLPFARAAAGAGHAVAFACPASMAAAVESAGFTALASGERPAGPAARVPLQPPDRRREERDLRERFVRRTGRYRAKHLLPDLEAWRPDVVVCDETDFGGVVAAERLGLPFATVLVIAAGGFVRPDVVAEALDELRAEHQLAPDPKLETPGRYLVLSPFPPCFRDPGHPLPATAHCFRPATIAPAPEPGGAPPTAPPRSDATTVYFTLGTVFNRECGDLFERVLRGLCELSVDVVATLGPEVDPQELGAWPPRIRLARYIPQAEVLPLCDLVVSHGGSGSVMGALAHGLPSVLLPIGADQPLNAERCAALGVGRVLDPMRVTPRELRACVEEALADVGLRRNAAHVQNEIAALPPAAAAVPLLERLAAERGPIRA